MPPTLLKYCSHCHSHKSLVQFYEGHKTKDGYSSWCRNCTCTTVKEARDRKRGAPCPIPMSSQCKPGESWCSSCHTMQPISHFWMKKQTGKPRSQCKICTQHINKKYQDGHKEWIRKYNENYRSTHISQIRETARKRNENNPEKNRQRVRAWQKQNPQKVADSSARRRARESNAPVVEKIDRLALYLRDKGMCHICHHHVSKKSFTLDHLVPLVHGGEHTARNLAIAHRSCNSRRGAGYIPAQLRLLG